MLSKDETLKNNLLLSCCVVALLPETAHFTCAIALLLCVIMRGASYLYYFPTHKLTGVDFTWGWNNNFIFIIFIYSFIAGFSPQGLHCSF